jgi:ubiquinone/menaquinone biosynthesis C-methylase UbiE
MRALSQVSRRLVFAALLLLTIGGMIAQQTASHQRKTSEPYTGDLSIFETPGRDQQLHIDEVMDALSIAPGKNVADIGAGSGWFTVRAAKRVTDSGTVYAVDINPEAIKYIEQRITKDGVHNVKTIVSKPDDPQLPARSIDAVLLLKTYHEVANPVLLMRNLRPALRPDARIGIIDRNGNGTDHGVQKKVVVQEMTQAGYQLKDEKDSLVTEGNPEGYFLIFAAK